MLWPLPVLATVIRWQPLFQVFCTPFSLTKNLLIYLLFAYIWRIPSHFLFLPLAPCLLTLQRFSSSLPLFPLLLPECLLTLSCHSTSCLLPASVFILETEWVEVMSVLRENSCTESLTPEGHLRGPWQIRKETTVFLSDIQSFSPGVSFSIQTYCPGDSSSLQDPFFRGDNCLGFFSWPCLTLNYY